MAVVPDEAVCVRRLLAAGAVPLFEGRIEDRRLDTAERELWSRDHVLRVRVARDTAGARCLLDWKGPTSYEHGYKHRDEISLAVEDAAVLLQLLDRLGYVVTREIDRDVAVFELRGAKVRIERFARMDTLLEVEGLPAAIEDAILTVGLPRAGFTAERLSAFVLRFESRTGQRAAICDREARGDYCYSVDDA
jgi:predicted adenylyl cyclase CyaB